MEFKEIDEKGKTTNARSVPQSKLTSECWLVQFSGLERCKQCEFVDTDDCGGPQIRETGKNSKGYGVPLGEQI